MKKKKTPEIRFKGFANDWEQCKLGDIVTEVNRTDESSIAPVMMITAENGFIKQSERYSYNNSGKSLKKYIVLKYGELAYNHGASKLRPYGSCFALTTEKEARIPFVYHCFYSNRNNARFLSLILNSEVVANQLKRIISSGARMDGLLNISFEDYKTIRIMLPTKETQDKIVDYFIYLDTLISLHKRKLTKLQLLKKSMLTKMFPKDGARVPEIRFQGFHDDWEYHKLGEVIESYSGGTPSVGVREYYGGDIPFIRSAEINSKSTELFLTNAGLNNSSARLVSQGDILYALYGATSGEVGRARLSGAINQAILAIKPNSGYDSEYIIQWLQKNKQNITDTYLQGGQGNLSGTIVKEFLVQFPSYTEQRKIGKYFHHIDSFITLHQHKISKLQQIKHSMLSKLFV